MPHTRTKECVLCGKCLEVCPLLAATGREELSPRAKAHLAGLLERDPEALNEQDMARLAELCLGCGRCRDACSQGVNVPDAVSRLREAHPRWKTWLWQQWMTRAGTLWPLAGKTAGKLPDKLAQAGPERLSGLMKSARALGRVARPPFVEITAVPGVPSSEALLFSGCSATFAAPYWTIAAKSLCSSLNIALIEAEFSCCGTGLAGAGLRSERQDAAQRNVDLWRGANRPRIITFCASCHAGLAGYASDRSLFPDQDEARAWQTALTPLAGLVTNLLNSARFVVSPMAPTDLAYHRPCHVHANDGQDRDETLLRALFDDRELAISRDCCGFGGVMQLGAPELAKQVNHRCWQELAPRPGTLVLTGCTACVFQLAATAPEGVHVAHWLECIKISNDS